MLDCVMKIRATASIWRRRRTFRRELRNELLPQPDSVLEDAGWTRAEAEAEAQRPFWRASSRSGIEPPPGAARSLAKLEFASGNIVDFATRRSAGSH